MPLEHAKRKLAHFVDVEDLDAVQSCVGPGFHLVNHFLLTEADFLRKYDRVSTIWFGAFLRLLTDLGAPWPEPASALPSHPLEPTDAVIMRLPPGLDAWLPMHEVAFHAGRYVTANPDVAQSTSAPLMHYLRFGHGEGRRLIPVPGMAR